MKGLVDKHGTFMKEMKKRLLSRLLQFVICNLSVLLIGFIATLIVGTFAFTEAADNRFWTDLVFDASMTLGIIIPFCPLYFLNHGEYKRFYFKKREEGHSENAIIKMHAAQFAKYEFLMLLLLSLVLSLFPTAVLGKIGIGIVLTSASFFVDFLPIYMLQNTSFIVRLLGWLLWDAYIAGLYIICLKISYRIWEKNKLRK